MKDSTLKQIQDLSKEIGRIDKRIEHLSQVKEDKLSELKNLLNTIAHEGTH